MFNIFKRKNPKIDLPQINLPQEPVPAPTEPQEKKPRKKKDPVEPSVDIKKIDFDHNNPHLGSFELDWNKEFISLLKKHGYSGQTDEMIVNSWFIDLCRTIAVEEINNLPDIPKVLIDKRNVGNGRTSIS